MCLQQHRRITASCLRRTVRATTRMLPSSPASGAVELVGAENVFVIMSNGAGVNILAAKILQESCDCFSVCIPDL